MDTTAGMRTIPRHEDSDDAWRAWADSYPSFSSAGLRCIEIVGPTAVFEFSETAFPLNPNGAVNGGVVALAVDQIMGVLGARIAPTGSMPVTAVLQVQYHAPALPPLRMEARAIQNGRALQAIEVVVHDALGRRCSTATGTMAIGRLEQRIAPAARA
ncbi:PaaI family thioesterase [Nocardioides humilatus]|uniref:PaaI family thioesterase n=1 Tax=Nocardioides humilatus TaxID=2607660 RepID=A0A5B1LQD2_9ACTN|nr:PaaI family thioesterase [Nocardioides humilatus]KAA1421899.1 PaaI family thioesterase [Nocardioides humilatus]